MRVLVSKAMPGYAHQGSPRASSQSPRGFSSPRSRSGSIGGGRLTPAARGLLTIINPERWKQPNGQLFDLPSWAFGNQAAH